MIKRMLWFVLGIVAGIAGWRYVKDKARDAKDGFSVEVLIEDLLAWARDGSKQVEEIVRNLLAKDDVHRSSRDADVFVSGSATNDRPQDL